MVMTVLLIRSAWNYVQLDINSSWSRDRPRLLAFVLPRLRQKTMKEPFKQFEAVVARRLEECNAFYEGITPSGLDLTAPRLCSKLWRGCSGRNSISTTMSTSDFPASH